MNEVPSKISVSALPTAPMLSVAEFAQAVGLSKAAVYKRIRSGTLKCTGDGERYWIDPGELAAFVVASKKTRRTITTSPALDALISQYLSSYGDVSGMFESGAWIMFMLRGEVSAQEASDHLSADTLQKLLYLCAWFSAEARK